MARKTVVVSDLSGAEIQKGKGAQVTIKFNDARKGTIVVDVTDSEAEQMERKVGDRLGGVEGPNSVSEVPSGSKPIEGVGTRSPESDGDLR